MVGQKRRDFDLLPGKTFHTLIYEPTKKTCTETIVHALLSKLYRRQHNLKLAESENTIKEKRDNYYLEKNTMAINDRRRQL